SVGGSNADGGLGDGYLKFVNVGRFFKLPKDALSLRVGQFELDLPFSPARSHNLSGWDIFDEANIGAQNSVFPNQNVNNAFAMSSAADGVELSGGHLYRGYHYSFAVINQNTGGTQHPGTMFLQWWASSPIPTSKTSTGASHTDSTWNMILPAVMKFRRLALRVLTTIPISTWAVSFSMDVPFRGSTGSNPTA